MNKPSKKRNRRALEWSMCTGGGTPADWIVKLALQAVVFSLAVFGSLFCLLSCYRFAVMEARLVWTALALIVTLLAVYWLKWWRPLILLCALLGALWFWWNAEALFQGALDLLEQALQPMKLQLPEFLKSMRVVPDGGTALDRATLAVQGLLYLSALPAGYCIIRRCSVIGLIFSTITLLLPAPFFALAPAVVPCFCLTASYLMLYVFYCSVSLPPSDEDANGRAIRVYRPVSPAAQRPAQRLLTLAALPLIVLAAFVSSLLLPEQGYRRPEGIQSLRQELLELDLGDMLRRGNDGLSHGNLRNLSAIRFTGDTALKVRASEERALYLRGFAGTVFTSAGWESVPDAAYRSHAEAFAGLAPQNLHAAAVSATGGQGDAYTLSVENVAASPFSLWTPNGLISRAEEIEKASYAQDTALQAGSSARISGYTVEALPCDAMLANVPFAGEAPDISNIREAYLSAAGGAMGLQEAPGENAQRVQRAARAYLNYVFEYYTALPEETRLAAERLCRENGLSLQTHDGALNLMRTLRQLRGLLVGRCAYAYAPPRIPADADFATYFLNQSRRGYCVHFATTATVLLRALGIPARYAEGYIVIRSDYEKQADDEGYFPIEDTHAHAWAEVYDPVRLEWIPVEMTPTSGDGDSSLPDDGQAGGGTASPTPDSTPEPTPEPISEIAPETTSSAQPEPSVTPEMAEAPSQPDDSPVPEPMGADGASAPEGAEFAPAKRMRMLLFVLLAAGLALAPVLWRRAVQKRRRRQFYQRDVNAAALAICGLAVSMLRFAGVPPPQPLQTPEAYADTISKRVPWLDQARVLWLLDLARRAKFSGKICTKQERNEAVACVRQLSLKIKGRLPRVRRLLFSWRYPEL